MRFIWPTTLSSEPNTLVRFGRVLHWTGAAIAMAIILLGVTFASGQPRQAISYLVLFGGVGVVVYFAGRALRYIFSGE